MAKSTGFLFFTMCCFFPSHSAVHVKHSKYLTSSFRGDAMLFTHHVRSFVKGENYRAGCSFIDFYTPFFKPVLE